MTAVSIDGNTASTFSIDSSGTEITAMPAASCSVSVTGDGVTVSYPTSSEGTVNSCGGGLGS